MSMKGGWRFWAFAVVLPSIVLGIVGGAVTFAWLMRQPAADTPGPITEAPALPPLTGKRAVQLIERAARGHYTDALALTAPGSLDKELLQKRVGDFAPKVSAANPLPDERMLVWVAYERDGQRLGAHYLVTLRDDLVTALEGPFAPIRGYQTFHMDAYQEDGALIRASSLRGKGMVLVAPRRPDPTLPPLLEELRLETEERGARFILAMDTAAPDWGDYARSQGYNGEIWRLKGNLETLSTISAFPFRGMIGVLVDRAGTVVAPLSVIEPLHYGMASDETTQILPTVIKAYGLTP